MGDREPHGEGRRDPSPAPRLITGGVGLVLAIVGAVSLAMAKTRFRVVDHPALVLDARGGGSSVGFRF